MYVYLDHESKKTHRQNQHIAIYIYFWSDQSRTHLPFISFSYVRCMFNVRKKSKQPIPQTNIIIIVIRVKPVIIILSLPSSGQFVGCVCVRFKIVYRVLIYSIYFYLEQVSAITFVFIYYQNFPTFFLNQKMTKNCIQLKQIIFGVLYVQHIQGRRK